MRRLISLALLLASFSTPLFAFDRGNVLLEDRTQTASYEVWLHFGWRYALPIATPLIYKAIPYIGPGHFIVPAPNELIFHDGRTVSVWDGVNRIFTEEGKGYNDIFTADTELSEIIPMRNGRFLVAERWNDLATGARLIQFDLNGRLAGYRFPTLVDAQNRAVGAEHIALLADQCTLLYTLGSDAPASNAVHRMNICSGEAESDFATLIGGEEAGSIRQLAGGDVIVANGSAVLQFNPSGSLVRTYEFPGVTHLALTVDGSSFWAAAVHDDQQALRHYDPSAPDGRPESVQIGNDEMRTIVVPAAVSDLVVVGEGVPVPAGRGRAARH